LPYAPPKAALCDAAMEEVRALPVPPFKARLRIRAMWTTGDLGLRAR
jgi:hypothetical protein